MRHILLFEPDPTGHRMVFVRYIAEAIERSGSMRATLLTSERARAAPWLASLAQTGSHLTVECIDVSDGRRSGVPMPAKFARQFHHTRLLRTAVSRMQASQRIDHVFIPFVDDYSLYPFAVAPRPFGDIAWSGIAIRPRFHLAQMGAIVPARWQDRLEALAYRGLMRNRTLDTLFCIDPYLAPSLRDPRVRTICDPADITDRAADPAWLPVPEDAVTLLVYGYIDHRKGIDRLLAAVADPRVPPALTVALVGSQAPGMEPVLQGPLARTLREQGRLIEVARHVGEDEEASAFARADIIWGYYPGSYCSSGAMVRAGQMGKPLMATAEGLVGHITREQQSGLTASETDGEALVAQLVRLASDRNLRESLGAAGRAHFAASTSAAFGDEIVARLMASMPRTTGES
jgi:glycosyltransferase involved in cell wall biosynthesis